MVSALDCLGVCLTWARGQQAVCDGSTIKLRDGNVVPPMCILLGLASGQVISEPAVQKAALRCIANCVCTPEAKVSCKKKNH